MASSVVGLLSMLRNVFSERLTGKGNTVVLGLMTLVFCVLVILDILSRYGYLGPQVNLTPEITELANLLRNVSYVT